MIVKNMNVDLAMWGANKGEYTGEIKFVGTEGEVKINLSDEISRKIIAICAEGIVRAAQEVATKMTVNNLLEQLESPRTLP